jgi:large subunit ribosomal protein L1
MGKIRIKTIGDQQLEEAQKEEEKIKREQKDLRKAQDSGKKKAHIAGMKGGERTATVGVSEEDIMAQLESVPSETKETSEEKIEASKIKSASYEKAKSKKKKKILSKRHKENKQSLRPSASPAGLKSLSEAIEQLRIFKKGSFDETVELHINTKEKGISGTVSLPHGTGKTLRIKVADDVLVSQIESGKIDFDVLVSNPSMMPKLAGVAKILGPRGLMPNPKNGTITDNTSEAVEKLSKGQIGFKTESGAPIIHLSVGKLSFEDKKLSDNISTVLTAIGPARISNVTLKSTMSPAVKLSIQNIK